MSDYSAASVIITLVLSLTLLLGLGVGLAFERDERLIGIEYISPCLNDGYTRKHCIEKANLELQETR